MVSADSSDPSPLLSLPPRPAAPRGHQPPLRGMWWPSRPLLHDTLWVKQGEQHHRSLTCARRVPHTYHHICPEAPPTGLVAPLPWTRTLDGGHMLWRCKDWNPVTRLPSALSFPWLTLSPPLFPGARKVSLRSTGAGHPHRPSTVFLSETVGWASRTRASPAVVESLCRAVPARRAGLLICAVTEVWGAGLKGGRFDPRSCWGSVTFSAGPRIWLWMCKIFLMPKARYRWM